MVSQAIWTTGWPGPLGKAQFFPFVWSKPGLVPWCFLRRRSQFTRRSPTHPAVLSSYSELAWSGSLPTPHKPAQSSVPAVKCGQCTSAYECIKTSPSLLVAPEYLHHLQPEWLLLLCSPRGGAQSHHFLISYSCSALLTSQLWKEASSEVEGLRSEVPFAPPRLSTVAWASALPTGPTDVMASDRGAQFPDIPQGNQHLLPSLNCTSPSSSLYVTINGQSLHRF